MNNNNILLAANILFNHRLNRTSIKNNLPLKLIPENIEDAYKIQNELKILYLTLKDNYIIGKKVGCTNKIAQKQVNIFEPFYGNLFSKFCNNNGCKLKSEKFSNPFFEPEISFILKEDINIKKAPFSINDTEDLFDGMFASIEIVDFRFGNNIREVGIKNLIISNGASEYIIKSDDIYSINKINLENQKIYLSINNSIIEEGNTNLVLNNPLNSALWVINKLASIGEPMLKGQFITTGSCTKAVKVEKNSKIKAFFGDLGTIEFEYL